MKNKKTRQLFFTNYNVINKRPRTNYRIANFFQKITNFIPQ